MLICQAISDIIVMKGVVIMTRRKTQAEFENEVNIAHNGNVEVLGQYVNSVTPILVRYKDCGHEETKIPAKLLYAKHGCRKCRDKKASATKTKTTEKYIADLKRKGLDHIEVLEEYKGIRSQIKVKNHKCGHVYSATAGNILNNESGCPICHGEKDTELFQMALDKKYPKEYTVLGEYINGLTPILLRHNPCGKEFETTPKSVLRWIKCPYCIKSKGEWYISKYLDDHNVPYEREAYIEGCNGRTGNRLHFDFRIHVDGEVRLIEYDGDQHFKWARSPYHNDAVYVNDEIKNNFCREHNIPLLRIPYWWLRTKNKTKILTALDEFCLRK